MPTRKKKHNCWLYVLNEVAIWILGAVIAAFILNFFIFIGYAFWLIRPVTKTDWIAFVSIIFIIGITFFVAWYDVKYNK